MLEDTIQELIVKKSPVFDIIQHPFARENVFQTTLNNLNHRTNPIIWLLFRLSYQMFIFQANRKGANVLQVSPGRNEECVFHRPVLQRDSHSGLCHPPYLFSTSVTFSRRPLIRKLFILSSL